MTTAEIIPWDEELRSVPLKIMLGPTVYEWVARMATDQKRRNPGEMARILLEGCYEGMLKQKADATEAAPPLPVLNVPPPKQRLIAPVKRHSRKNGVRA